MNTQIKEIKGLLLDDDTLLTIAELSHACAVHGEWIAMLVDEGVLQPQGEVASQWQFTASSLVRVRRIKRLQHDLGLNLAGAALAIELLDEIEALRCKIEVLERIG